MSKWTNEQLLAINSEGKNIIVSAGAGSGKTAVLSERVLRKINDNVPINKLLILTFTNEAAKEMKDRIRKKLINEKKSDQLNLLEESYITTFDSYSLSIVKKYHYLLNVSKDIKIIDDTIISNLKDKFIITMIGRLSNEKRQDVLIDAISKSKYAEKIQLVLAGQGPNYEKYIKLGNKLTNKPLIKFLDKKSLLNLLRLH